jgi:hypothetical protein
VHQRELEQAIAEEDDLLGPVEHPKVGLEPHLERVLAEDPVAERVERGDLDVSVAVLHQRVDALFHLGRGLVGEGERQDLFGTRFLLGDEPGNAPRDDGGLAGAGAGNDQEGAGIVGNGLALLVVQAAEDALTRHAVSTIAGASDPGEPHRRTSGPPASTSATSCGLTSAMSPQVEHLRAPTAVPASTASWRSRPRSTAQRNPAA